MTALPARTALSDTYQLPTNSTFRTGSGVLWDVLNEFTEKSEISIASAATMEIGAALSTKLKVTGTVGITSLGTTYRGAILLRFAGVCTITHNASTLWVAGGASYTTTANDLLLATPKASVSGTPDGWCLAILCGGFATVSANIAMGGYKVTGIGAATARTDAMSLANVQDGTGVYSSTVGGTADTITLTPSPAITAYVAGHRIDWKASGANTTAVTVNVSGVGGKALTKNGTTALAAGDIPSGAMVRAVYDGTRYIITSVSGVNAAITAGTIAGTTVNSSSVGASSASTVKATTLETTSVVGIGVAPSSSTGIYLGWNPTGATSASSVACTGLIQSGVTVGYRSFHSNSSTAAAAFTLTQLDHFYANPPSKGGGSTITSQFGFHVESTLTDATSNYGFFGDIAAATGRWNVYMQGTARNYLRGNLGIGSGMSVPVNALDVSGPIGFGVPATKALDFTVGDTDNWLITNKGSSLTVTLPTASSYSGRIITIKTITAFTVVSASSNVIPQIGGAASTAILAGTAGKWATLVSNGTAWEIMQSN